MKPWPFYRKMQNFIPGTQPRGTYSFDPSSSSVPSVLDKVNAEEDGVEDRDGPPLDLSHANITSAFFSSNLNILGFGALPSKPLAFHFSSSGGAMPPSLSSLPPMAHLGHPYSTQPCDLSMGSGLAFSQTNSNPGNTQHRKRKHDGQLAGGTHPPSTKHLFKSKASDVNPVIMSTTLNSTINRMFDVMEKMLSSTAITTAPAAHPTTNTTNISSTVTSPSQSAQPLPNPPLASLQEVLNQAMKITTSNDTLTEDQLLPVSLFFTSATESTVHTAHTFIALNNNQVV